MFFSNKRMEAVGGGVGGPNTGDTSQDGFTSLELPPPTTSGVGVSPSLVHQRWNRGLRQSLQHSRSFLLRTGLGGGGGSTKSDRSTTPWQHHVDLRFVDSFVEDAFLQFYMQDWFTRISYGVLASAMILSNIISAPNASPTINILYQTVFALWGGSALILYLLKWIADRVVLLQRRNNERLEDSLASRQTKLHDDDEIESMASSTTTSLAQVLNLNGVDPETVLTIVCRAAEVVSLIGIYGGNILDCIAIALGRLKCDNQPLQDRQEQCYNTFYFESNMMLVTLFASVAAPVRFSKFLTAAVTMIAAFCGANLLGPAESFVSRRFYTSLGIFSSQILSCVVWVYYVEHQRRETFISRQEQEAANVETREMRRLAGEAASRRLPEHIVKCLSTRGRFDCFSQEGIVCGFGIANFSKWAAGRGPADVVHALKRILSECDETLQPLFHDPILETTRLQTLGDTLLYAVLPPASSFISDDAHASSVPSEWVLQAASVLWSTVVEALSNADAVCQTLDLDCLENNMLVPQYQCEGATKGDGGATLVLIPVGCITTGSLSIRFLPKAGGVIGVGTALEECRARLAEFQLATQASMRLSVSPVFAEIASGGGGGADSEGIMNRLRGPKKYPTATPRSQNKLNLSTRLESNSGALHFSFRNKNGNNRKDGARRVVSNAAAAASSSSKARRPPPGGGGVNPMALHDAFGDDDDDEDDHQTTDKDAQRERKMVKHNNEMDSETSTHLNHPWYWFAKFRSSTTEAAFLKHARYGFDVHHVAVTGWSMTAMSSMMLVTIAVYHQWDWSLYAPLPYTLLALLSGIALLACSYYLPSIHQRCGVLEALYWVFMISCNASSIMSPQFDSIFGGSLLPWACLASTASQLRPMWYGPVALWLIEAFQRGVGIVYILLPTRIMLPGIRLVTLLVYVVAFFGTLVVRRLLDLAERQRFAAKIDLQQTQVAMELESRRLVAALAAIAPNPIALKLLSRELKRDHRLHQPGQEGNPHTHLGPRRIGADKVHPLRSTSFSTSVEDQAYALLQFKFPHPRLPSSTVAPTSPSSSGINGGVDSSSPLLPLVDDGISMHCDHVSRIHDLVARVLESRSSISNGLGGVHQQSTKRLNRNMLIVKSTGDTCMITSDRLHHTEPLGDSCAAVLDAALMCHRELLRTEPSVLMRGYLDSCPMIGALLGNRTPTFEWYAPEIDRGLSLLRLGSKCGPMEWGSIVCSARFRYNVSMVSMMLEEEEEEEEEEGKDQKYVNKKKKRFGDIPSAVWRVKALGNQRIGVIISN